MKSPTLADARKLNLIPSVTTILRILDKPALNDWKVTQGVLAVMTSKQNPGEELDAFIHRVLQVERVQDQEAAGARDKGTAIHAALEAYFTGQEVHEDMRPWIGPAAEAIAARGKLVAAEKILVGDGFAGKTDLIQESPACWWIVDYKTTKKLPEKGAWPEAILQLAAYAKAFSRTLDTGGIVPTDTKPIRTANVYISTVEQGKFVVWENDPDWQRAYNEAFRPLVSVWQYLNNYKAQQ